MNAHLISNESGPITLTAGLEMESEHPIKVAVVEDNEMVRTALASIVQKSPGLKLAGQFPDGEIAIEDIERLAPDVIVMDIHLPGRSGIECTRAIKRRLPRPRILMFSIQEDPRRVYDSLEAGATGYIAKSASPEEIVRAIREVHRGGTPMSSQVARRLVQEFKRSRDISASDSLTQEEAEQLRNYLKSAREIPDSIGLGRSFTTRCAGWVRRLIGKE
jgi:DNA-binding NarL/FixJ family response regulator